MAEQPTEYALKSPTAWINANNPGPHCTLGLTAAKTRDAEAEYDTNRATYISQINVTQAIINALNTAIPKQFKRGTNAAGLILGANPYRNNQDPRSILLALRTLYGKPSPAEKQANANSFREQWNPADPIKTYFDRLEDCYVTALIATPPFTMPQMCDMAITSLQLTGLYSDAFTEYERLPAAQQTWDDLKTHFTSAYNTKLIAGTQKLPAPTVSHHQQSHAPQVRSTTTSTTTTTTTASPADMMCPSGIPVRLVPTPRTIISAAAPAPTSVRTNKPDMMSASAASTKPSCPSTQGHIKLDGEGHRMRNT
jgi:hypothetical protein